MEALIKPDGSTLTSASVFYAMPPDLILKIS